MALAPVDLEVGADVLGTFFTLACWYLLCLCPCL